MTRVDSRPGPVEAFTALARIRYDGPGDARDLMDELVGRATALVGADAATLALDDGRAGLWVALTPTGDVATDHQLRSRTGGGPRRVGGRPATPVRVPGRVSTARRWPRRAGAVPRCGPFASVYTVPMRRRADIVGALTLFHRIPTTVAADDLELAQAWADIATVTILQEREIRHSETVIAQLQTALDSRVVIEQAKGMIAQCLGIDMNGAFDRLRRHARRHNLRLADLARSVVDARLDPRALPPLAPAHVHHGSDPAS